MQADADTRWLDATAPLAVEGSRTDVRGTLRSAHVIRVRDLRERFGDAEVYAAECSCGWRSEPHSDINAERTARRDGTNHISRHSPPHGRARQVA
jgi:hypothetical protein